jgi:hypothetical protein
MNTLPLRIDPDFSSVNRRWGFGRVLFLFNFYCRCNVDTDVANSDVRQNNTSPAVYLLVIRLVMLLCDNGNSCVYSRLPTEATAG